MIHEDQKAGLPDTRLLQAERAQSQPSTPAARDEQAELAALRRALLLYGTAGKALDAANLH